MPRDPNEQNTFWKSDAAQLLDQALGVYPDERYDAIIVDEAQDFEMDWWLSVDELLRNKDSTFYVFYDPNQQIYGGGLAENLSLQTTTLKYNCRNTGRIAKFSCDLVDLEPVLKPGTPPGTAVRQPPPCNEQSDMVNAVRRCVHDLVTENQVATQDIVILTTGKLDSSPVYQAKKLGNISLVELEQKPGPNEIRMASLHRFKGLESPAIIVCDVRPGDQESKPKHLYVATSRACHYLAVFTYAS